MSVLQKPAWVAEHAADIAEILSLYPNKRSALMPLAHLAQEWRGYLTAEDYAAIGEIIGESAGYVESSCTFYTLFRQHPHGKYTFVLCTNLACAMENGFELASYLESKLGIKAGETTPDGLFTLEVTHECLAACDGAPCGQMNLMYFLKLTPEKIDEIIEMARNDQLPGVQPDLRSFEAYKRHAAGRNDA